MSMPIYTRRFRSQFDRSRSISDFEAMLLIKCNNRNEYNRIMNDTMNRCPFFRTLTPQSLAILAGRNKKGADQIVHSIASAFCDEYESEYDFYMLKKYSM